MDVFDLHCDLLYYLAFSDGRTPYDDASRCSLPQLKKGGVTHQTLAIFAETSPNSVTLAKKQLAALAQLPPELTFHPAIENASTFCLETEPLSTGLSRFDTFPTPLYVSLTWNGENRFGGGVGSTTGLKPDGRTLLSHLANRNIPVDLSHTSDPLAYDILSSKHCPPILASHSNFRDVIDHPRNLPTDIAREIIHRNGLIGLVFYPKFLGTSLTPHIEFALSLGAAKNLALGADFFCPTDGPIKHSFHPHMSSSACYPSVLERLPFPQELIDDIASKNALTFLSTLNL